MNKIILLLVSLFAITSFSEPKSESTELRKISVTGFAEREVMPDIANINFSSHTKDENLAKASKENQTNIENFKNDLKKNNIKYSNLETTNFYTQQTNEFYRDENVERKIKNDFESILTFYVELKDLTKISPLLTMLEKNGVTDFEEVDFAENVYSLTLNSNDKSQSKALNDVFKKFDNLKAQALKMGIQESDILIGAYSTETSSTYDDEKTKTFNNVYNNFVLKLDDIKEINEIIQIAEKNKIYLTGNITFDISDRENIESELYNEAYEKSKEKARDILTFSSMSLLDPLVVSEDIAYQYNAISDVKNYSLQSKVAGNMEFNEDMIVEKERGGSPEPAPAPPTVDYTPQPIKIMKDISILFEIK